MIWWILIILVHLSLILVAFSLAKKSGETQWSLFASICLIPFVGPIVVILAYIVNAAIQNEYKPTKRDLDSSSKS